ncbi:uncharacterized protein FA14DRAFT_178931 [Meira miltonrushii]|uniref:Required for respiratory growth protein 7, mitochondrial n=1 Tax=Meira miltonrushii TaxID=1280837 RepID=A0A316VDB8_9BASI|nr:uncharacterized protein FA14DRAFT_178931 [Meira miltonrushii]PWN35562.1 hypothetical protein FA14DRAFT_178931 [Meira miltonrushii]
MVIGGMTGSIARTALRQISRNVRGGITESTQISSVLTRKHLQINEQRIASQRSSRSIHTSSNGGGQRAKASSKASASASINATGSSIAHDSTQGSILSASPESFLSTLEQEGEKQRMKMSTVQRGTTYEEHVKSFLQKTFPRMDLMRIGGAHDGGIDLTGWWWSPLKELAESSLSETLKAGRVRITVQCKSEARKLGPRHVREMHGTMVAIQRSGSIEPEPLDALPQSVLEASKLALDSHDSSVPAMAILASSSGFSKQCLLQAFSAPFPLLLVHLLFPDQQGNVLQDSTPFAHPTIAANDALLTGLLQSQLQVRWSSTLATPIVKQGRGRKPNPVKIDMPALYLGGKRL